MASSAAAPSLSSQQTTPLCSNVKCPFKQSCVEKVKLCYHCMQFAYCSGECCKADNWRHRKYCPLNTQERIATIEAAIRGVKQQRAMTLQSENQELSASMARVADCQKSRTQQEMRLAALPCIIELSQHCNSNARKKTAVEQEINLLQTLVKETDYLLAFPETKDWATHKQQKLMEWIALDKTEIMYLDVSNSYLQSTSMNIENRVRGLAPSVIALPSQQARR